MNAEKEITFADLKAKFTKDFDSFGKMDPFLEFTAGKCVARTETASSNILFYVGAGKEPAWKNQVVLVYFDQAFLTVRAYDEDATENQFIGTAKVEIKSLRFPGSAIEANVLTDAGENIGTITGKYTIKNLAAVPLLLVKNIKCDFVKEHSFLGKTKPYLQLKSEQGSTCTDHKEEVKGVSLSWNDSLRLRIKENSKVFVALLDKNQNETYIFKYQSNAKEYRMQNGTKKFNVLDKGYLYLGTVQFDFETVNLVSKEESVKNTDKEKKSDGELTSIGIDKVKLDLKKGNKEVYLKILIGSNELSTTPVKYETSTLPLDLKKTIYAENKENKMIILLWEKNLLKDKVIGQSTFALENLASGEKKFPLVDEESKEKAEIGSIVFNFTVKQVSSKIINLDAFLVTFTQGADLIGDSEPYIVARVGGWSGRTETGDANRFTFKKGIEIKYFDEEVLELQVWDEDVTNDELMYAQKVNLIDFKGQKGDYSITLTKKENDKIGKRGKLTFKYDIKNNVPQEIPRKQSEKKIAPEVKPEPKPEHKVAHKQEKVIEMKPEQSNVQVKSEPKAEPKVQPKGEEKAVTERKAFNSSKTIEPKPAESFPSAREKRLTEQQPQSDKNIPQNGDATKREQTNKNTNRSLNKQSRSKETLNLPSIISSHLNYGDRIFDKQSAATLQKTILVYSMPKAPRFINEPKYSGEPSYCLDSCFKPSSTKGVGFGYGRKKQYPDWMEKNMKENPPPGAYFDNNSDIRSRGPTFGISHKFYEKVMIPKEKRNSSQLNRKLEPIKDIPK